MPENTPAPRGPNNRRQAETVGRNRQILANVLADPEALALAAARGRPQAKLNEGLALADAFLTTYTGRDDATGDQTAARLTLREADRAARREMGALRSALRALYDGEAEHLERLGVARKDLAEDRDAFLTESRSTLAAVREDPYKTAADEVGFTEAALDAAEAAVEALGQRAGAQTSAAGSHTGATDARDEAYAAFMGWMKPTRRLLKLAYRDRPDVAARVGL